MSYRLPYRRRMITYPPELFNTMPLDIVEFINDEKLSCEEHNIDMMLTDSVSIDISDGPAQGNGCFEETDSENLKGVLTCAVGKPLEEWLPTFVHETCHKDQCLEQVDVWTNGRYGAYESMDLIDLWIRNLVELSPKQKDRYFKASIEVELDCEIRAIAKIEKYNLPIDVIEYTQKANAYVLFYQVMRLTRRWYTIGKEPYALESVWSHMPKTIMGTGEYTTYPSMDLLGKIADGTMGGHSWKDTLILLEKCEE